MKSLLDIEPEVLYLETIYTSLAPPMLANYLSKHKETVEHQYKMGLSQKETQIVEKPKHNKTSNLKIRSPNGYDVIRERLDKHNALTVKHQPVGSVKTTTKASIRFNQNEYFWFLINIEKTTAPYQASDFTGFSDSYAVPAGNSDVIFTGSVNITLPTGITQQAFDTLSTARKCTHIMEQQNLFSLPPNENVTIITLRSKLLVLENSYSNPKNDEQFICYLSWKPSSSNS